jgi:hypothetical protein
MIFNYSSVFKRDNKIHDVAGLFTISDGIRVERLKVMIPAFLIIALFGYLLGGILNFSLINIFNDNFSFKYTTTVFTIGIVVGIILYDVKITTIRLYEYLIAYFKPRRYYTNENHVRNRIYKPTTVEVNEIFRSIL